MYKLDCKYELIKFKMARRVQLTSFGGTAPSGLDVPNPAFTNGSNNKPSEGQITSAMLMEKLYRKYATDDPNYGKTEELDKAINARIKANQEKSKRAQDEIEAEAQKPKKKSKKSVKKKQACDCKMSCPSGQSAIKAHCRGKGTKK